MRKYFVLAGLLLLVAGSALAQDDFPKVETSPAFMFIRNPVSDATKSAQFNCAGGGGTIAYNFSKAFGIAADMGGCKFFGDTLGLGNTINGYQFTYLFGPRFTYRSKSKITPFAELGVGGDRLSANCKSSASQCLSSFGTVTYSVNAFALAVGTGFDYKINRKFSLRPIQAEYLYTRFRNACPGSFCTGNNNQNGFRLKSGIVIAWGGAAPVPPAATCSVQPSQVMVGEPITATASGSNFDPKHTLSYSWDASGGKVTGKDSGASIDTAGVAGGSYSVTAHVTDPKKKGAEASCSASFTVKELPKNPPTMSCSASPSSVQAGTGSTVSCTCSSPDNVPVTVAAWSASSGNISGSANGATLDTTGAAPGTITVGATCTDSRGLTTSASSMVTVEAPPPPVVNEVEVRLRLHSVYFQTAKPSVAKPDEGLLASQQQTLTNLAADFLLYLQTKPDAHLILTGHADVRGSVPYNQALSERRVNKAKNFLVAQGVPAANIDIVAQGDQHNLTADEVKDLVDSNKDLTPEERERIMKKNNLQVITWASNRRVDVTLSTTGETSGKHFPFNAVDALTLIGGREADEKKAEAAKKARAKKKMN